MQNHLPFFAPTDAAFSKIDPNTLNALFNDPAKLNDLKKILTYHVVSGFVPAFEVVKLDRTSTLNGKDAHIAVKNG